MRTKIKYIAFFLLLFAVGAFVTPKTCYGASADVQISADTTEVTVGDNVFVYININSDTVFGDFEANVTYNDDILEYNGGSPVVTGDSGFLKVSDRNKTEGDQSRKYTLQFKAMQVGICKISFSGRAMVYDLESGNEMSVSVNELTLNIKAPATASTNALLKTMKISPSELNPAFDPGVYEYQTKISYDVQQLVISALPEDSKAAVSITGNDFLKEGENKVIITVLAESGDIIEYTINVFRDYAPDNAAVSATPAPVQNTNGFFEIDGAQYVIFGGKYKLVQPNSDIDIPDGYSQESVNIAGITITAYLPIDNKESEFILVYAMNEYGDSGFYQYDRVEKTLQRYATDGYIFNNSHNGTSEASQTEKYNNNMTRAVIVIALLSAFCTLMIFVTIRMFFKLKGYKEDDMD
jgi:hypothetical protein